MKFIGICYYPNVLKEEKKIQKTTLTKFLCKRILSNKQHIRYDLVSVDMLYFETQEFGWDLSMMRISYNLEMSIKEQQKLKRSKNLRKYIIS